MCPPSFNRWPAMWKYRSSNLRCTFFIYFSWQTTCLGPCPLGKWEWIVTWQQENLLIPVDQTASSTARQPCRHARSNSSAQIHRFSRSLIVTTTTSQMLTYQKPQFVRLSLIPLDLPSSETKEEKSTLWVLLKLTEILLFPLTLYTTKVIASKWGLEQF